MKTLSHQLSIITTMWKEFLGDVILVFSDMPIKYRQVFMPMIDGLFQSSLVLASDLIEKEDMKNRRDSLRLICQWQSIFEICLTKGFIKETKISQISKKLGELKIASHKLLGINSL